jgi:hypothetical protein
MTHRHQRGWLKKEKRSDPMTFSQLQLIQSQVHGLRAPQTAPEQQSDQSSMSPATQGALGNGIQ